MTKDAPRRRTKPVTEEEKRNLKTGLRKMYAPPADGDFDELLRKIARATKS